MDAGFFLANAQDHNLFKVDEYELNEGTIHRILMPSRNIEIKIKENGKNMRFSPRSASKMAKILSNDYFKESLEEIRKRRNGRLKEFCEVLFKNTDYNCVVTGSPDSPFIIVNNKLLSVFVRNFWLNFTSAPKGGEVVASIKLTKDPEFNKDELLSIIYHVEHREAYRLRYKGTNLFLSPFKHYNEYPAFACSGERIFESKTAVLAEKHTLSEYNLEIV